MLWWEDTATRGEARECPGRETWTRPPMRPNPIHPPSRLVAARQAGNSPRLKRSELRGQRSRPRPPCRRPPNAQKRAPGDLRPFRRSEKAAPSFAAGGWGKHRSRAFPLRGGAPQDCKQCRAPQALLAQPHAQAEEARATVKREHRRGNPPRPPRNKGARACGRPRANHAASLPPPPH